MMGKNCYMHLIQMGNLVFISGNYIYIHVFLGHNQYLLAMFRKIKISSVHCWPIHLYSWKLLILHQSKYLTSYNFSSLLKSYFKSMRYFTKKQKLIFISNILIFSNYNFLFFLIYLLNKYKKSNTISIFLLLFFLFL